MVDAPLRTPALGRRAKRNPRLRGALSGYGADDSPLRQLVIDVVVELHQRGVQP